MFGVDPEGEGEDAEELKTSETKYAWLYSIYSLPNMLLPLVGGYLVDKLGIRICCITFSFFLFLGQLICNLSGNFAGNFLFIVLIFNSNKYRFLVCVF